MATSMPRNPTRAANRGPLDIVRAAAIAALVSGAPSTAHAVVSGRSPFAALRAAAALVPAGARRSGVAEAGAGLAVHAAISLGWTAVLATVLPSRGTVLWGAVAGGAIAALDLGVVGRRIPAIAELPTVPQVADHVVFGATVGLVFSRTAARRGSGGSRCSSR
jgi:hypothetical protein